MAKQIIGNSARLCAVLATTMLASCGGGGDDGNGSAAAAPTELAAAMPDGDHILFASVGVAVTEFDRTGSISVVRTGDAIAAASVNYRFNDGSATNGEDFRADDGVLTWAAGEAGAKSITFELYPDVETEPLEIFEIQLFGLSGDETISGASSINIDLADSGCQQVFGNISSNTSWALPCYHITETVTLSGDSQLEIEDGVTVIAEANSGINVTQNATIHVDGTQALPVRLKGVTSAVASWNGITITSVNSLQHMNHMIIDGANIGVDLDPVAHLGSFTNNTLKNTGVAALRIPTSAIDALGGDLTFDNNTGGIRLLTQTITNSNPLTLVPQATHYSTGQSFIVDGPLVLEPGVDLRFDADTQMYIGQNGSLHAVGTEAQPIMITGVHPEPGIWNGIQWVSSNSTANQLSHVTVEYGGGDPARAGNLIVAGSGVNLLMQNTTLGNSAGYGLYQISTGSVISQISVTYLDNVMGDHFIP